MSETLGYIHSVETFGLVDGPGVRYIIFLQEMCIRDSINTTINEVLAGMDASDIYAVDAAMLKADGTKGNPIR